MRTISEVRADIDRADDAIAAALSARFALSDEMLELKAAIRASGGEAPAVDADRERAIYERVLAASPAAHRDTVYSIYERILGGSRGMVETIARGVCVFNGRVLLCRQKGSKTSYLPGGHIEFGETGARALVREVAEELGVPSSAGGFLGVVENSFLQHGRRHSEINLVYELRLEDPGSCFPEPASREPWLEFEWRDLADIASAGLLPEPMLQYLVPENGAKGGT